MGKQLIKLHLGDVFFFLDVVCYKGFICFFIAYTLRRKRNKN